MYAILIGWGSKCLAVFVFVSPGMRGKLELFGTGFLSIFLNQMFSKKYVK
jgi:hypothetical protein